MNPMQSRGLPPACWRCMANEAQRSAWQPPSWNHPEATEACCAGIRSRRSTGTTGRAEQWRGGLRGGLEMRERKNPKQINYLGLCTGGDGVRLTQNLMLSHAV